MDDIIEILKIIAIIFSGITAVIGIWKLFAKLIHIIDSVKEDIEDVKRHSMENYLTGLRLTIMSDNMPLGERVIAAEKYISEGGNGEVKKYAIEHLHINEVIKDEKG